MDELLDKQSDVNDNLLECLMVKLPNIFDKCCEYLSVNDLLNFSMVTKRFVFLYSICVYSNDLITVYASRLWITNSCQRILFSSWI